MGNFMILKINANSRTPNPYPNKAYSESWGKDGGKGARGEKKKAHSAQAKEVDSSVSPTTDPNIVVRSPENQQNDLPGALVYDKTRELY